MNPQSPVCLEFVSTEPVTAFVGRSNARLAALGMGPIGATAGAPRFGHRDPKAPSLAEFGVEVLPVTLTPPKDGLPQGWTFVTRIDLCDGGDADSNQNRSSPSPWADDDLVAHTGWGRPCQCFHCNQRMSQSYYMTRSDASSKTSFQLGTACLPEVLHRVSGNCPPNVLDRLNYLAGLSASLRELQKQDRELRMGQGAALHFDVRHVLALSAAVIRRHGFASAAQDHTPGRSPAFVSTKRRLAGILNKRVPEDGLVPSRADMALADEVLAWARASLQRRKDMDPYHRDLVTAVVAPYAPEKALGLIASAAPTYVRETGLHRDLLVPPSGVVSEGPGRSISGLVAPPVRHSVPRKPAPIEPEREYLF